MPSLVCYVSAGVVVAVGLVMFANGVLGSIRFIEEDARDFQAWTGIITFMILLISLCIIIIHNLAVSMCKVL